jgi:hypothetical protein
MQKYILCTIGIVGSFFLIKYRESIGDTLGEAERMRKVGGIYQVIVYIAIIIFFWSLAELTNTTSIFFAPLYLLLPTSGSPDGGFF